MIEGLVGLVIYLMILGLICWLLMFLIDYIPVPAPFNRVAKIVIMVVAVIIVIYVLLGLLGHTPPSLRLGR